jgi:hypothetical protein
VYGSETEGTDMLRVITYKYYYDESFVLQKIIFHHLLLLLDEVAEAHLESGRTKLLLCTPKI